MLHLAGHDHLRDAFLFQDFNQAAELAERDPVAARGKAFDFGRGLFLDPDGDNFVAELSRCFERQQRETPIAGDHAVLTHFTNPRWDEAIKASSSSISGPISTSLLIRSTACVVFN